MVASFGHEQAERVVMLNKPRGFKKTKNIMYVMHTIKN